MSWIALTVAVFAHLVAALGCSPSNASDPEGGENGTGENGTGGVQACPNGVCPPGAGGALTGGGNGPGGGAGGTNGQGGGSTTTGGGPNQGTAGTAGGGGSAPTGYGGYITSGGWHGYAWTATSPGSSTIMPPDFATAVDFPLCASGRVAAGTMNVAMVGWNISQAAEEGEPVAVAPTLDGITVSVQNPGESQLRLQIQAPDGGTNADHRWCAVIPGTGGFIPFDAFDTECWGSTGKPYAGEPISAVLVLVPGLDGAPVDFDFCVTALQETNEDGSAPTSGCSLEGGPGEGGGEVTGTDTRTVTRDGRQYVVQNNVWNGNSQNQAIEVNGVSFEVTRQDNGAGTTGAPASFPSVFIGSNFGHSTSGSNLPKAVSALTQVPTSWRWSSASGTFNAAYDVWFSTTQNGDQGTPSGGYLMVWLHDPADAQPLGGPQGPTSISGETWNVWVCNQDNDCNQNGVPVISYVATRTLSEYSFDLAEFIRDATTNWRGTIQSGWYLSNVFAGFEIWSEGVGLRTENFCAVVL